MRTETGSERLSTGAVNEAVHARDVALAARIEAARQRAAADAARAPCPPPPQQHSAVTAVTESGAAALVAQCRQAHPNIPETYLATASPSGPTAPAPSAAGAAVGAVVPAEAATIFGVDISVSSLSRCPGAAYEGAISQMESQIGEIHDSFNAIQNEANLILTDYRGIEQASRSGGLMGRARAMIATNNLMISHRG